jgi:preprotein translocase subunit SecG
VELVLSILQVLISVVLIFLVLMHSGKDSGLSGAFGVGTGAGPLGGGSLVERNLNRWTIAFAIAFALNTIALLKLYTARAQAVTPVILRAATRTAGQTTPLAKRRP